MPDAHGATGPFSDARERLTKRIYKYDFVQFSPPGVDDILLGTVVRILRESERPRDRVFVIQHYNRGEPITEFTKVSGSNTTLHPIGRPGVVED
jgi:hypothetical protein